MSTTPLPWFRRDQSSLPTLPFLADISLFQCSCNHMLNLLALVSDVGACVFTLQTERRNLKYKKVSNLFVFLVLNDTAVYHIMRKNMLLSLFLFLSLVYQVKPATFIISQCFQGEYNGTYLQFLPKFMHIRIVFHFFSSS